MALHHGMNRTTVSLIPSNIKKIGQPRPLFHLFSSFRTNVVASRIQTRIVRVEGKDTDH